MRYTGDIKNLQGTYAYATGRHVVAGHIIQKVTEGTGESARTKVLIILGEGEWDGIEALYYNGQLIAPQDYHFHPGNLVDPDSTDSAHAGAQGVDSWNEGGLNYSGSAYVIVNLPAGVTSEDDLTKVKAICRCLKVYDFDDHGNVIGYGYSTNPARVFADLLRRRNVVRIVNGVDVRQRVNWRSWTTWRSFCNEEIPWEGGTTPGRPTYSLRDMVLGSDAGILASAMNAEARTEQAIPDAATGGFFDTDIGSDNGNLWVGFVTSPTIPSTISGSPVVAGIAFLPNGTFRFVFDNVVTGNAHAYMVGDRVRVAVENGEFAFYYMGEKVDPGVAVPTPPSYPLYGFVGSHEAGGEILRASFNPIASAARSRRRFECQLAFPQLTDIAAAQEAVLYISAADYQDVDGKITFLPPSIAGRERTPTFTFNMSNIIEGTFKAYRLTRDQKPTVLNGSYRNSDDQYLSEDTIPITRDTLADLLGRENDPGPISLGTMTQGQAQNVLNYHMRMSSDLDLYAAFKGDGTTWEVTPGDVIEISHDVTEWVDLQCLVIEATDESSSETADERSFLVQIFNPNTYSDADQTPLQANVPKTGSSRLVGPTPAIITSAVQTSGYTPNGGFQTLIEGHIKFGDYGSFPQRARVWAKKPSEAALPGDGQMVAFLRPDENNEADFSFAVTETGTYTVKVVSESGIGLINRNVVHPTTPVDIIKQIVVLPPPTNWQARAGLNNVVFSWNSPTTNPERVKAYEIWNDTLTTRLATVRATQVTNGAFTWVAAFTPNASPTSINYAIRSIDDMDNASSFVRLASPLSLVDLPNITAMLMDFDGLNLLMTWTDIAPLALNFANYVVGRNSSFVPASMVVGRPKNASLIEPVTDFSSRSFTRYVCAEDILGNRSAVTSQILNVPAPPAPTVTLLQAYATSLIFTVTPDVTTKRQNITRTVVDVASNSTFTNMLYSLTLDGMQESVVVLAQRSAVPTVYVRVHYEDRFGAGANSGSASGSFTQISNNDVAANAIDIANFAASIRPVQIYTGAALPTLPNATYPANQAVIFWTNAGKLYRNVNDVWSASVPTSDLTGTVSGTQLAPDAGAITPVSGLPTLPNATYPLNKLVLNTADGKLYKNIGNTWVSLVNTADLTGTISAAQLAVGSVTANAVAANAIVAGAIAAGAVTATAMAANSIAAVALQADAVVAGKIAAGAVNAREIAAEAIRVTNLSVGLGDNLMENGSFEIGSISDTNVPDAWYGYMTRIVSTTAPHGDYVGRLGGSQFNTANSRAVPVTAGDKMFLRYRVKSDLNGLNCLAAAVYFATTRPSAGYVAPETAAAGVALLGTVTSTSWVEYVTEFTVPAGVSWMSLHFRSGVTAVLNVASSYDDIECRKQAGRAYILDAAIDFAKISTLQTSNWAPYVSAVQPGDGIYFAANAYNALNGALAINTPTGATIRGVPFTEVQARATYAIDNIGRFIGADRDVPDITKFTYADFADYHFVWEDEIAYVSIFVNFDNYQSDTLNNLMSVDHVKVTVLNKFGDAVLPYGFMYFPWNGRGVAAHMMHTRRYCDPWEEAVYKFELHNVKGYSRPIYFSRAPWVGFSGLNGIGMASATAPTWKDRRACAQNLQARAADEQSVQLSWTPPANGAAVNVYYRQYYPTGHAGAWLGVWAGITTSTVTVPNLSPNTRYEFMVDTGAYQWSNTAMARTFPTSIPQPSSVTTYPAPTGLAAAPASTSQNNVSWINNSMVDYIEISIDGGGWSNIGRVTSYAHTGLAANSTHSYKVRATYTNGTLGWAATTGTSSQSEQVSATTLSEPPPTSTTPKNLNAEATGYTTIQLSWTGGTVNVYRKVGVLGGYALRATGVSSGWTDTGLASNQAYVYKVTNDGGTTYSNESSATTWYFEPDPDPYCVLPETLISIVDATGARGTLEAWQVRSGERALVVNPLTGEVCVGTVKNAFAGQTSQLITIVTESGKQLSMSPSHPVITDVGDVHGTAAHRLTPASTVLVCDDAGIRRERVVSMEKLDITKRVISFEMEDSAHTFVSNDIVSHNIREK